MTLGRVDGRTLRYQHRRAELPAAATEYVLEHGLADLSLRPVAQALGVTHATLLRHFSSKDNLVSAVARQIHADLAVMLATDTEALEARSASDLIRIVWRRLCEPREQRQFRLLFELVAGRGRGPGATADLARSLVNDRLDLIAERLTQDGWSPQDSSVLATVVLAQVCGLPLDLLLFRRLHVSRPRTRHRPPARRTPGPSERGRHLHSAPRRARMSL